MEDAELSRYLSEMVMRYPNMRTQFTHQGRHHDQLYEAEYDHQGDDATCLQCDVGRQSEESCGQTVGYREPHAGNHAAGG
jgi:hypothetical protein